MFSIIDAVGYSVVLNSTWSWRQDVLGGDILTPRQKSQIKQHAIETGLIQKIEVRKVEGLRYGFADFRGAGVVYETKPLPEELWLATDENQFDYLNELIGGPKQGMTWHHSEIPGQMELVPFGIHKIVPHNGGRSPGMWAFAPR
ncbi:TPA: HNH endonuclease [Streptococcus suis]|nr:HNH endonuclease [Streptococcus suis]